MSARRPGAARGEALERLVVDVPDFPEPGIVFKDITPLLADHDGFTAVVEALAAAGRDDDGRRGRRQGGRHGGARFILGAPVALALGVGFVPVRKAGKLPRATHAVSYALEYGEATLEMHRDAHRAGRAGAARRRRARHRRHRRAPRAELVERCGGTRAGVAVLMELGFLAGPRRPSATSRSPSS